MKELALLLNRRRSERGSIDFDLPEPIIEFDEQGRMQGVVRSVRNIAHRIIEEFMLAANEAVAQYLDKRGIASLHRVHEKPDPKKVLEFEETGARVRLFAGRRGSGGAADRGEARAGAGRRASGTQRAGTHAAHDGGVAGG